MDKMRELLPCPFCGGEAWVITVPMFEFTRHAVQCKGCGITTESDAYASAATNHWNTRATHKEPEDMREAFEKILLHYETNDQDAVGKGYRKACLDALVQATIQSHPQPSIHDFEYQGCPTCDGFKSKPSERSGEVALTRQQVSDRFSFLEGLVNERTYREITDAAIKIQAQAISATAPSRVQLKDAVSILRRFVYLKDYKNKHGKDGHYLQMQPQLWEEARALLAAMKGEK